MNKILFVLLFCSIFFKAQNVHVEYINKNSEFTSFKENLYIHGSKVVSIRDSITIQKSDKRSKMTDSGEGIFFVKDQLYKIYYYKDLNNVKVLIRDYIDGKKYLIEDVLPTVHWNIDYTDTKDILGYTCHKATSVFRGSKITAYYTKEIKLQTGPYKFGGLDGLILEVFEENATINSWTATKIETIEKSLNGIFKFKEAGITITLKQFLEMSKKRIDEDFDKLLKTIPKGVVVNRNSIERKGIEKKYEWEN